MKNWKAANEVELVGKKVLVRGDLDVDDGDNPRVRSVIEIVKYALENGAEKIRVIGHRETDYPICIDLRKRFETVEFDDGLRSNPGEKENSDEYAAQLADGFDIYINEAFATSHRKHASIDALPRYMKASGREVVLGLRFEKELEMLGDVWNKPGKRVLVIGGVKIDDKQRFAEMMKDKFENILRGGKLPGVQTREDGLDISDEVIAEYEGIISKAEVILAAGVMGKYEDLQSAKGTKRILEAIAGNEKAYKVAGGGDIEMAISTYGLTDKFDWISVGGGAMLEYLESGTLVGLEAVTT